MFHGDAAFSCAVLPPRISVSGGGMAAAELFRPADLGSGDRCSLSEQRPSSSVSRESLASIIRGPSGLSNGPRHDAGRHRWGDDDAPEAFTSLTSATRLTVSANSGLRKFFGVQRHTFAHRRTGRAAEQLRERYR